MDWSTGNASTQALAIVDARDVSAPGFDEPQRRVHRVVFGLVAHAGEDIGQHPLIDEAGERLQDPARCVVPTGGKREAGQRDHGVAAPVAEPRIAGDDRLAIGNFGERTREHEAVGGKDELVDPGRRADQLGHLYLCTAQLAEVAGLRAPQSFVEIHGRLRIEARHHAYPFPWMQRQLGFAYAEMTVAVRQAAFTLRG